MYILSLCSLNCLLGLWTFSIIVIVISLMLCPFWLKCSPVALFLTLFLMYPRCSEKRSCNVLYVWPIYCWGHFLHPTLYTTFLVWQLTLAFISIEKLLWVAFTVFPTSMYGHIGQELHFLIPTRFLFGLEGSYFGTLALISLSFRFGGLL